MGLIAPWRDGPFLVVGAGVLLILLVGGRTDAGAQVVLLAGFLVPLGAAGVAAAVARHVRHVRHVRQPAAAGWWLFALAAALGALAHAAGAAAGPAAIAAAPLRGAALFALGGGTLALLHSRPYGRAMERWADAALLAAASLDVALRLSVAGGPRVAAEATTALATVLVPAAALFLLLPCSVLLATRLRSPARGVAVCLAAAALLLAVPVLHALLTAGPDAAAAPPRHAAGVAAAGGWLLLLCASAWIMRGGVAAAGLAAAEAGAHLLRQLAAPVAALALALVLLDGALRSALTPAAGLALAALGALLAWRVSLLLQATRRQSAERRELAQSRALVEVSQALAAGSTELDETLQLVTDWASRLFGARGAAIELLAEDDTVLVLHSAHGLPASLLGLRSPVASTFTGWVVRHGRTRATLDPRTEHDMAPAGLPVLGDSPVAAAPLHFRGRTLGVLACIGSRPFDAEDLDLLGALAEQAAVAIANARLFREVRLLSMTDPLTRLPNRRQLERELRREFSAAQRGRRLVVVMFDLDGFKAYNDRHGHPAGDAALCLFADVLTSLTRRENLAVRLGGDEFLSLLADTDARGAGIFVERVRARFHERIAELGGAELSVSAGLAEYRSAMASSDQLIAAADRALYENKLERTRT